MRKRWKLLVALAALAAVGLSTLLLPDPEPRYRDRSLSEWLSPFWGFRDPDNSAIAQEAISQIGTNAIPHLLRWIAYEPRPSKSREWIAATVSKAPFLARIGWVKGWLARPVKRQSLAESAVTAFHILGPSASGASPELTRMALISANPVSAARAADALSAIGPAALPGLVAVITYRDARPRSYVIHFFAGMGTNARLALPALTNTLLDPKDPCASDAAKTLGRLRLQPELVVPALERALQDTRPEVRISAAYALAEFGELARPAVPALRTAALADPDPKVRRQIDDALSIILIFDDPTPN